MEATPTPYEDDTPKPPESPARNAKVWAAAGAAAVLVGIVSMFGLNQSTTPLASSNSAAGSQPATESSGGATSGGDTAAAGSGDQSAAAPAAGSSGSVEAASGGQVAANGQGGTAMAGAGGRQGDRGVHGTISAIDGSTLTVTSQGRGPKPDQSTGSTTSTTQPSSSTTTRTVKVTTSADTVVTKAAAGTLADVKVGDNVKVDGSGTSAALTAERIVDFNDQEPPAKPAKTTEQGTTSSGSSTQAAPADGQGRGDHAHAVGKVASVSGSTITVTLADGSTSTVTTTDTTTVTNVTKIAVSDLKVGDNVDVHGTTGDDGTVAATNIRTGDMPMGGRGGHGGGGRGHGGGGRGGPPPQGGQNVTTPTTAQATSV